MGAVVKCGSVTVDKDGNVRREEWGTDEAAEQFMERIDKVFTELKDIQPPSSIRLHPKAWELLKRMSN